MMYVANPIYDSVFKYLMSDDRAAKCLLSALLGREVVELTLRPNEYSNTRAKEISIFRIDFAAKVRDKDGDIQLVLIELQKTWLPTETLRFRQYLGVQYSNPSNMQMGEDGKETWGVPIVAIYILGHRIDNTGEPIIYVHRKYLNSSKEPIEHYNDKRNPFIESLTHDSIIVQIPDLTGRVRNYAERIMNIFDQSRQVESDPHVLSIDDESQKSFDAPEEQHIRHCLLMAGTDPDIRQKMNVEDEILSEVEKRDTLLLQKDKQIAEKESQIAEKESQIAEKESQIAEKESQIAEKESQIAEKESQIAKKDSQIAEKESRITEQQKAIRNAAKALMAMPNAKVEDVAKTLGLSVEDMNELLK